MAVNSTSATSEPMAVKPMSFDTILYVETSLPIEQLLVALLVTRAIISTVSGL
jgi:hypothetical protein